MSTKLKTRPKVVSEPAPRSAERAALASAIAARAACVEHAAACVAAVDAARRNAGRDRAAIVVAQKDIATAEVLVADRLIAQARGLPEPEGMSPDEAKSAVAALESKVAEHETAISHLQERLDEARRRTQEATDKVTARVHDVLRAAPEIRRFYVDFATATKTRATLYAVACGLPGADVRPRDIEISTEPDYAVVRLWNSVVDRLMADADAELPN